jgi:hypothetical protein
MPGAAAAGLILLGSAMVSISEELKAAKVAAVAIKVLTASPKSGVLRTLKSANHIAILNLSNEGPLNEARKNAGIALSNLMHKPMTPEKIDKAKGAVEEWISQLGAA